MTETFLPESNRSVATNSIKIMIAQGLGVFFGLSYDITIAALFGATRQMDAIFAAITIPQIFASVMISISLRVFTPVFTEAYERGGADRLRTIFSGVLNYNILLWCGVGLIGFVGAQIIIFLQTPGFDLQARQLSLIAFRILLLNVVMIGIVEPIRAYLVYRNYLVLASLANFFRFFSALVVLLVLNERLAIQAVPWAYVAGGLAQLLIFSTAFFSIGGTYKLTLGRSEGTWQIIRTRFGPPFIGEIIGQTGVIIERMFASFLPPGVLSALGYGRRVLVALNGVINQSVSVAILPRISREAVANEVRKLRESIVFSTKFLSLGTGLTAVMIIGFSPVIVKTLFQRGAFDTAAAEATGTMLQLYIPSIFFIGISQLLLMPFYGFGETTIIRNLRILFLFNNTLLAIILFSLFNGYGLAAAFTFTTSINTVLVYRALSRRLGKFALELAPYFLKLSAILIMVGVVLHYGLDSVSRTSSEFIGLALNGLVAILAVAVFFILILVFRLIPRDSVQRFVNEIRSQRT